MTDNPAAPPMPQTMNVQTPSPLMNLIDAVVQQQLPLMPAPGAMTAAPLTGQGQPDPHAKPEPQVKPSTRPPRPAFKPQQMASPTTAKVMQAHGPSVNLQPQQPVPPQSYDWSYAQPALTSLMTQTLNMQRPNMQHFHLIVLFEDSWPTREEYTDVTLLVKRLKELLGQPCCVFPFLGHFMPITDGLHKFMQTPTGPIPLFEIPDANSAAMSQYGWIGGDMDVPQAPDSEVLEPGEVDGETDGENINDTDNDDDVEPLDTHEEFDNSQVV